MWIIYALLSAFFAALVAIFAKIGMKGVDSDIATAIRTARTGDTLTAAAASAATATGGKRRRRHKRSKKGPRTAAAHAVGDERSRLLLSSA